MREHKVDHIGYRAIVSGRVQGVGFRYFTAKEANKLGVYGHAKNLNNGNVEVLMFGHEAQLRVLLKWLVNGPKTSTVDDVKVTEILYIHKDGFLCL
ncbi:acylphosphatase [Psychromonas hadalis]|uniref:acylphosphatase n=1 Tax=Psychromonas hadalis TaxID=211669 RepID=UPI0003B5A469|nr:acylphosphatase [Psychromonas hadalis]